jgi:cytochrome c-type biogenesis protein CcmH
MAPTAKISDHARVIVSARISKSGNAVPQPGDLLGQAAAVAPGTRGVQVTISETVPK